MANSESVLLYKCYYPFGRVVCARIVFPRNYTLKLTHGFMSNTGGMWAKQANFYVGYLYFYVEINKTLDLLIKECYTVHSIKC